jgi:hypothetical protein
MTGEKSKKLRAALKLRVTFLLCGCGLKLLFESKAFTWPTPFCIYSSIRFRGHFLGVCEGVLSRDFTG